jgi:hypothetical protein
MNQVVAEGARRCHQLMVRLHRHPYPYMASGWRRFCQRHEIVAGHFVVFNYDGEHQITVSVFNETMLVLKEAGKIHWCHLTPILIWWLRHCFQALII